ncbi:hypothetical protein J3R30DRAFT_3694315 [Lentinula aciculospora]|uniref:Elongator complex protein 6 n=1 Tax=Lentinula aciculospora TaxID=153920 RepID=A0A9W9AWD5_9AGAR|nr:hypothetical protein J3R30DRAFT_3694315 [Lentinula aciculospora]
MLSHFDLPEEIFLLITDELPSPADFALYQCLVSHIKEKQDSTLRIVLSVSESISRWQSILAKSNVNLSQQIAAKMVHFVDVTSLAPVHNDSDEVHANPFRVLYEQISTIIENKNHDLKPGALVMVDDISSLEWIGYSTSDLFKLCRALRALCLKKQATLVIRHHIVTPGELDPLFQHLHSLCTYHLDVRPLTSGRSGAVSGQIALHSGPNAVPPSAARTRQRSSALQYRLTDGNAVFFERGSSRGVL